MAGLRIRRNGFTLVELIIAMFVFGLFSTIVANTVVAAYQQHSIRTQDMNILRRGTITMDTINRELRMCDDLKYPSTSDGNTYEAYFDNSRTPKKKPLVFQYYQQSSASEVIVGYWRDASTNSLVRMTYNSWGGVSTIPATSVTLCTCVKTFTFTRVALSSTNNVQFITCDLGLQRPVKPMKSEAIYAVPLQIEAQVISL